MSFVTVVEQRISVVCCSMLCWLLYLGSHSCDVNNSWVLRRQTWRFFKQVCFTTLLSGLLILSVCCQWKSRLVVSVVMWFSTSCRMCERRSQFSVDWMLVFRDSVLQVLMRKLIKSAKSVEPLQNVYTCLTPWLYPWNNSSERYKL